MAETRRIDVSNRAADEIASFARDDQALALLAINWIALDPAPSEDRTKRPAPFPQHPGTFIAFFGELVLEYRYTDEVLEIIGVKCKLRNFPGQR